ncbi:gap junction alpha-9 protein [Aplochiton taeniatus]
MGDWNFLGGILEEVHIHSTMVGKIWLTILFIFRMLVLGVAAEDVWNDEQADFICNTEQPGCRNVCYDLAFPISLIRYWVLQVIFVSSPSLVYMGHALYRLRALEKERQRKKALLRRELEAVDLELAEVRRKIEREIRQVDQGKVNKAPLRGSLLRTYVAHIFTRSAVEVGFMMGQYLLYGFHLDPLFKCERDPCPNSVDCYVSRPTEKSVFMTFMQCIAGVSLFLNLLEIVHLGYKKIKSVILDYYPHLRDDLDDYYSSKYKKDSMVQIGVSTQRKATIASAPSGYNLLMERAPDANIYPPYMSTSAFLPAQGDPSGPGSLEDPANETHSPTEHNCNTTSSGTRSPTCHSATPPKQEAEDLAQHPPHSEEENDHKSPETPKRSRKPSHTSSCPTLLVSAVRKPWRGTGSSNCSTVMEGRSSDTDSYGGSKAITEQPTSRARSKSTVKRPVTPESLDDSSSDSKHSPKLPQSNRSPSLSSSVGSKRASDLKI